MPLAADLFAAPQVLGDALAMPLSGRRVDKLGGGRLVLGGCIVLTLAPCRSSP